MSITVDGSDNQKYGLPHFAEKGHEDSKGYKQPMKLYGAIVHGIMTKVMGLCCVCVNTML
jgi:hypothetical protein